MLLSVSCLKCSHIYALRLASRRLKCTPRVRICIYDVYRLQSTPQMMCIHQPYSSTPAFTLFVYTHYSSIVVPKAKLVETAYTIQLHQCINHGSSKPNHANPRVLCACMNVSVNTCGQLNIIIQIVHYLLCLNFLNYIGKDWSRV